MYIRVCLCYVNGMCEGTYGGQKRALEPLELELQVVVSYLTWVLGWNLVF